MTRKLDALQTAEAEIDVLRKEREILRMWLAAEKKNVRDLIDAINRVQDWDGTHVGDVVRRIDG